jgi:hypothetical protein
MNLTRCDKCSKEVTYQESIELGWELIQLTNYRPVDLCNDCVTQWLGWVAEGAEINA